MDIADTSKNGSVIEPQNFTNSPPSKQASCPFDLVLHDESMAVNNLLLLNPATDVEDELSLKQCESTVIDNSQDNTQKDWIAEPDSDQQAVVDSEFQQLLKLNEELQTANSDLYAQVGKLKQELAEAEKILQWQKKRSSVTDSMLNQQTQEASAAQEQIQSLVKQLETAVQTVQNQDIFLETHKAQLQLSQQRIAQLERECTLLQTNYSEQSQQLLQSENTGRELRTRLIRQQRQTLQFKAALEKCLDSPVPNDDSIEDSVYHSHDLTGGHTRFAKKARSLFTNTQPIQPWSSETGFVNDNCQDCHTQVDHSWLEASGSSTEQNDFAPISEPAESPLDVDDTPIPTQPPLLTVDQSTVTDTDIYSPPTSNLDQQLENLIEMFFSAQDAPSTAPKDNNINTNASDELMWENLGLNPQHHETAATAETLTEEDLLTDSNSSTTEDSPSTEFASSSNYQSSVNVPTENETNILEINDYWSELSINNLHPEPLNEYQLDQKSPSPLIYPQRPPKGRKSLASVELPNFPAQVHQSKVKGQ